MGEYCSAASKPFPEIAYSDPSFSWTVSDLNGKVSGFGSPPPKEIMPGTCRSGMSALIAEGCRRFATSEKNGA